MDICRTEIMFCLPSTHILSITHNVSSQEAHINKHTRLHSPCKGVHRCALGEEARENLCMDDPLGLVPVLGEPGAKV